MSLIIHTDIPSLAQFLQLAVVRQKLEVLHSEEMGDIVRVHTETSGVLDNGSQHQHLHLAQIQSLLEETDFCCRLAGGVFVDGDGNPPFGFGFGVAHLFDDAVHAFNNRFHIANLFYNYIY